MDKEKIKLTARQILLYLADAVIAGHDIFDARGYYRKSTKDYFKWRNIDKIQFHKDLYRLEKSDFIKRVLFGKERYIELTKKGKERVGRELVKSISIKLPNSWDYKWRMVIFDIPENKKSIRDFLAKRLKLLGFKSLQKSVFVFPFECKQEIGRIKYLYCISKYVQYIVAEQIETEIDLIGYFFDNKLLKSEMIKKINKIKK